MGHSSCSRRSLELSGSANKIHCQHGIPAASASEQICSDSRSDIIPHAYHPPVVLAARCPLSHSRQLCHTPTVLLQVFLAHQAMHCPGFPLACPRAEAAVLAASRAAQRAQAPLVPAAHLSAPGPVHNRATLLYVAPLLYSRALSELKEPVAPCMVKCRSSLPTEE